MSAEEDMFIQCLGFPEETARRGGVKTTKKFCAPGQRREYREERNTSPGNTL